MRTKIFKRIYALFAFVALVISFLLGNVVAPATAQTAQSAVSYDERDIREDLDDLGYVPELFVKNPVGNVQPLAFMEYGYSENGFIAQQYYGLYVYIYNPTGEAVTGGYNVVNMATAYDGGEVKSYENIPLKLLDATKDNLLLKFKVENAYARFYALQKKYAAESEKKERRYDIAGIQLAFGDELDTAFSKTFYFSGYSAGCGATTSSESTLTSRSEGLETIELNVGHTNYRTDVFVDNVCDELNTVYFSVPKRYFDDYGGLQKIKATWEEYKTLPIFVTNEKAAYDALLPYLFQDIGNRKDELSYRVLWDKYYDWGYGGGAGSQAFSFYTFRNAYNRLTGGSTQANSDISIVGTTYTHWEDTNDKGEAINDLSRMAWLFYAADAEFNEGEVVREDWRVSADEVAAWIETYGDKELFESSIDAGRIEYLDDKTATRGRITQEIDADEAKDLLFEKDQSWWDKLWHGVEYEDKPYSPIVTFTDVNDLGVSTAEKFAEKYYLNEQDCVYKSEKDKGIFQWCKDELAAGNYPVLFRFAQTDYYACNAYFDSEENKNFTGNDGYVVQETVFLDFDIISLTFRNDKAEETVIGVVADPIDIINGLDAPTNVATKDETWDWKKILRYAFYVVIGLLIAVPIVILVIKLGVQTVLSGVWFVVKWAFKGIWFVVKWIAIGLWWVIKQPFIGLYKLFKRIFRKEG